MSDKEKLTIEAWKYDLISRNGAIKALYRFCDENDTENPHIDALVDDVLGNLPEAHPMMYGWWIPVTERLPEESGYYLYLANHPHIGLQKGVGVSYFQHKAKEWKKVYTPCVTHWMPLPEPPKGGSNG